MEPEEFQRIRSLSGSHWWYRSLAHLVGTILEDGSPNSRILDAGCGTAFLCDAFPRDTLFGLDSSPLACAGWRQDGVPRSTQGSLEALPYPDGVFDVAVCLDVIYLRDVGSDETALRELHRVLAPGGKLLLQVAALQALMNRHDIVVHTARRYTLPQLQQTLIRTGFKISLLSYRNAIALIPIYLSRFLSGRGSNLHPLPVWLNHLLSTQSRIEWAAIHDGVPIPFGSSLVTLAYKPTIRPDQS